MKPVLATTRILGIDPGSQRTGVGIIDVDTAGGIRHVHHCALNLLAADSFPQRLKDLAIHEYAAKEIKLAVVGTGGAQKEQVQHMIGLMLNLPGKIQADAADALAVAVTHAHVRATARRIGVDVRQAWGRK